VQQGLVSSSIANGLPPPESQLHTTPPTCLPSVVDTSQRGCNGSLSQCPSTAGSTPSLLLVTPLPLTKPRLSVAALSEQYEEPGQCGSAADFFNLQSDFTIKTSRSKPTKTTSFNPRRLNLPSILLNATKPSVPVTALRETYEVTGPRESAANFFNPPRSTSIERLHRRVTFTLLRLHVNKDSTIWRRGRPNDRTTYRIDPLAANRNVIQRSPPSPTAHVLTPTSILLPVSPATSYNILAIDTAGQACSVTYMYGAAQAMALASVAAKTPFDPRSLDLPSIGALVPLVVLPPPAPTASNQVVVVTQPLSKLFTDDTGRFPVRARSGNQYVMIAFHAVGNLILQQAFKTKSDRHRIAAYNSIMTRLAARGLSVDLQILDNEASAAYKDAITFKWNATFQLVLPDMHWRNRAERAIRTFKDHFLAILAGVDAAFPPYLWDLLLPQAELTLNLLRQSTLNPRISAWEFFQGPFDFNKMPLGPVGCRVLIHAKPATRRSWDFRAKNGFYIGPAMDSYRCFKLVNADTKSQVISDTVEFRHSYLAIPAPSTEDRIIHGLQIVAGALTSALPPTSISQVEAITNLRDFFESWRLLAPPSFQPPRLPMPGRPRVPTQDSPRVVSPAPPTPACTITWSPPPRPSGSTFLSPTPVQAPFQATPQQLDFTGTPAPRVRPFPQSPLPVPLTGLPPREPIAHCTRSWAPAPASLALYAETLQSRVEPIGFAGLCRAMPTTEVTKFAGLCHELSLLDIPTALSVLDSSTGEFLEHRQLRQDPRYKTIWDTSTPTSSADCVKELGQDLLPNPN
jgi:hypothetical protein